MILDGIGRLLFPPKCVLCGALLDYYETVLCHTCRCDSPECGSRGKNYQFLESWTAIWYYEGNVRDSVLRFKFGNKRGYAPCYGRLLAMKLQQAHPEGFDCLTWVPTGFFRRLRRGYDQSELLARSVGAELGMEPVKLLRKIRNNPPQSGIHGVAERRANVLGVYKLEGPQSVAGKRILLIDDIITTGATAGEAARMLLTAGAEQVHCGVVAAARHHGKQSR